MQIPMNLAAGELREIKVNYSWGSLEDRQYREYLSKQNSQKLVDAGIYLTIGQRKFLWFYLEELSISYLKRVFKITLEQAQRIVENPDSRMHPLWSRNPRNPRALASLQAACLISSRVILSTVGTDPKGTGLVLDYARAKCREGCSFIHFVYLEYKSNSPL